MADASGRLHTFMSDFTLPSNGSGGPPNILVLIADDLSKFCLGSYGDPHVRTPNLDRLALQGMRFERAYITSPQCSPSRSSIFTGRTPHAIGTSRLHAELRPHIPTIVEPLRQRGYFTGVHGKHHLGPQFPDRFDYRGGFDDQVSGFFNQRPKDRPFFLWVGFPDPHRDLYTNYAHIKGAVPQPHDPAKVSVPPFLPDTPEMRADLALHYDAISRLDTECGRVLALLEQQQVADNTMVIFMSDHGMPYPRAKATLYEAGVSIPMIIRWPGAITPGSVTHELVSSLDLSATWLDAAGLPTLPGMEGRSLRKLFAGETHDHREYVFTERNWHDTWEPARGVVSERYSLICNCRPEVSYRGSLDHVSAPPWSIIVEEHRAGRLRPELETYFQVPRPGLEFYDLERDPHQFENLADDPAYARTMETMLHALDQWMRATNDFLPPPVTFPQIKVDWELTMERMLDGPLPKNGEGVSISRSGKR